VGGRFADALRASGSLPSETTRRRPVSALGVHRSSGCIVMIWLGVDVGGTFTDLVLYNTGSGRLSIAKAASTPHDQSDGILDGIAYLDCDLARIGRLVHGTTVATNTALERNGARLAVVTTNGHRDVLIVGRGERTALYDIKGRGPVPLLTRQDCIEVEERILADGTVLRPLDEGAVAGIGRQLGASGVEALAICFLNSYANPTHERRAAELLRDALPGCVVCASVDVLNEYREHARFFTAALNAYVAPRLQRYLRELQHRLVSSGYGGGIDVMTSSGGIVPAKRIEVLPAMSMLSGPAAGVIAAAHLGGQAGHRRLITYDMGGTSTDVCVIENGSWGMTSSSRVGGLPLALRQMDINTVGAGGGSIAELGTGNVLTVGPRSAGALPGPACYGRGGTKPTVTDANVVLGRLGTSEKLGGEIALDWARAEAVVGAVAQQLGLPTMTMAEGILRISVAHMTAAIKEISVMRGLDPREYALLAYGGAGPMHAALVADELSMHTVLVPPMPGNFSALGLLIADVRRDLVRTRLSRTAETGLVAFRSVLDELAQAASEELMAAGFPPERQRLQASVDMRYLGQAFELSVPVRIDQDDLATLEGHFNAIYAARYGEAAEGPTEIVTYRLTAWGMIEKPVMQALDHAGRSVTAAQRVLRPVVFGGTTHATPILARDLLPLERTWLGPAIIEESGTSTVVPPGWSVTLGTHGLLVLQRA
jgi:N-methylhydantoinase A